MEPDSLGSGKFHGPTSQCPTSISDYAPFLPQWKKNVASVRCSREFRTPQKIEIPRRIQFQILHAVRVHQNVIQIEQGDVWQLLGENALHFGVELLPHVLIHFPPRLVNES